MFSFDAQCLPSIGGPAERASRGRYVMLHADVLDAKCKRSIDKISMNWGLAYCLLAWLKLPGYNGLEPGENILES